MHTEDNANLIYFCVYSFYFFELLLAKIVRLYGNVTSPVFLTFLVVRSNFFSVVWSRFPWKLALGWVCFVLARVFSVLILPEFA
jgi:hypothetical protein